MLTFLYIFSHRLQGTIYSIVHRLNSTIVIYYIIYSIYSIVYLAAPHILRASQRHAPDTKRVTFTWS